MRRIILVALIINLSFATSLVAQKTKSKSHVEQASFGAEEPIDHPVKIPKDVLDSLRQSSPDGCFEKSDRSDEITAWFAASAIDLNGDGLADLVVKPENACLFGANIVPYWVFRNSGNHYDLVLETVSLSLAVLKTKTNGYRDIEVYAVSAEMIFEAKYKFNGSKYAPARCSEQSVDDAQHGNKGKKYSKCSDTNKPYR